jgi:alkanesulfonate monooxygenase SsuD/methylene tetrahydromethanopterin reductase-like flavin-dependent oxidoreductase (luciferase family)
VTGICLVIQRDTIQTAKLVAALDQVSGGRSLFGIDGGWNQEATSAPRGSMSADVGSARRHPADLGQVGRLYP